MLPVLSWCDEIADLWKLSRARVGYESRCGDDPLPARGVTHLLDRSGAVLELVGIDVVAHEMPLLSSSSKMVLMLKHALTWLINASILSSITSSSHSTRLG